jgi:hypothetical protein
MAISFNKTTGLALALAIFLLIVSALVLPQFSSSYEYCTGSEPYSKNAVGDTLTNGCCNAGSSTLVACSDCNQSTGYSTFLSTCSSLVDTQNNTHCYQCSNFGQKNTIQGLGFIILVVGLIAFVTWIKS